MLQVHRVGDRRSEAILAPNFWLENVATDRKSKMAGFAVTTAAHDSRAVGTAWHQSHRTIDPQCLKKSPPRRGGIYALTKHVPLHFTLNQDSRLIVTTGKQSSRPPHCDAGVTQNLPSLPKLTSLTPHGH